MIGWRDGDEQREAENDEQSRDLCVGSRSVRLITVKGAAACRRRCASVVIPLVTDGAILQARATMARVK